MKVTLQPRNNEKIISVLHLPEDESCLSGKWFVDGFELVVTVKGKNVIVKLETGI